MSELRGHLWSPGSLEWAASRWWALHRDRVVLIAASISAALPAVIALIRALSQGWAADGDRAVVATRAYDVFTAHPPLVGAFSTSTLLTGERTFSPGPLLYWLLAMPARVPGFLALPVTMGIVNMAALVGAVWLARRQAGTAFALVTAGALAVMCSSLPADLSIDIWAPSAPVLPFTLLIFVCWAVACGEVRLLPVAVLVMSFVAQCHLAYLPPSLLLLAIAVAGLAVSRRGGRPARRSIAAAAVVACVCWSLPIVDQALAWTGRSGHGNLGHILDAAHSRGATAGWKAGGHAVVRTVGLPAWWLRGSRSPEERTYDIFTPLSAFSIGSAALVLLTLVAGLVLGWRERRVDIAAGCASAIGLCVVIAIFTASFPNRGGMIFSYSHSAWWAAAAGMWAWLMAGWSALTLGRPQGLTQLTSQPAVAAIGVLAVVGVAAWAGLRTHDYAVEPDSFAPTRSLAAQLRHNVPPGGAVRVEGRSFGFDTTAVLTLRREGHSVGTDDAWQFGTSYEVAGKDFARILDVRDGRPLPPGSVPVARVRAASGPRQLVSFGLRASR